MSILYTSIAYASCIFPKETKMKDIRSMSIDEIETELLSYRKRDTELNNQLKLLFSKVTAILSNGLTEIFGGQYEMDINTQHTATLNLTDKIKKLIKENNDKFTSVEICDYFIKNGEFANLRSAKKVVFPILSRLNGNIIGHEKRGAAWKWLKDNQ
jgi:hypothetical protein